MAKPQFQDATPADIQELSSPPPVTRKPSEMANVQSAQPALADQAPAEEEAPPINRQPPDSQPRSDLTDPSTKLAPEIDALGKAFDDAENKMAVERSKTPEQREEEAAEAKRVEEEKAAEAAKTEAEKPAPVADEFETLIQNAEIEAKNPHTKVATRKRIGQLLDVIKKQRQDGEVSVKKTAELEAKLSEVAKNAPVAGETEEAKKLREEAAALRDENLRFRRRYQLESDPEVTKRFEEPAKRAEDSITNTLKNYQLGQPTLDLIAKEGGFAKFSKSNKVLRVPVPDPDNEGKVKYEERTASQITKGWLDAMNPTDSEAIKESMREQIRADRDKQSYIEAETAKADEHFKSLAANNSKATQEQAEQQAKMAKEYDAWVQETEGKTDWLKEQAIAANATPEQKASAEAHNKFVAETRAFMRKPPATVSEYQALVYDAVEARHLRRQQSSAANRIKELEAQVARMQKSTATISKPGSIMPGAAKAPDAASRKPKFDPMNPDAAVQALEAAFQNHEQRQ